MTPRHVDHPARPGDGGTAGAPPRADQDLLIDTTGVDRTLVPHLVEQLREPLPGSATVVVVHDSPDVVTEDETTQVVSPEARRAFEWRFSPARRLRVAEVDGRWHAQTEPLLSTPPADAADTAAAGLPPGPVFVGGTGRSGTTVIGRLLAAHPRWTTVHTELGFHAAREGFAAVIAGERTPQEFADAVAKKWYGRKSARGNFKGLRCIVGKPVLRWHLDRFVARAAGDPVEACAELMHGLVDPYAATRGAVGWAETTPDNAGAAGVLTATLPGSRVVNIVRDGRDVATSVAAMPWGVDTPAEGLKWWADRIRQADTSIRAVPADRVMTIHLEQLTLLDRTMTFDALMDFLEFDDTRAVRRYFDENFNAEAGNVGRWRKQLDPGEQSALDAAYRETLDQLRADGVSAMPVDPDIIDTVPR